MLISEQYPESFHYTNIDGVEGIIKSNSIWATHYSFLNDIEEMLRLRKFLTKYCNEEIASLIKRLNIDEKKLAERFPSENHIVGMTRISVENLHGAFLNKQSAEPYVASFCSVAKEDEYVRNNGLLSQWRGYAEGGYALVFDTKKIEELVESERYAIPGALALPSQPILKIGEVVYNEVDFVKKFTDEIKILKERVCWMAESSFVSPDKIDKRLFNEGTINKMSSSWMPAYMRCVTLYKDEGFKEEKEIRIAVFRIHDKYLKGLSTSKKEIKLRKEKGPYLELFKRQEIKKVKTRYPSDYLGIKRIIVGPGVDKEARASKLREFLKKNKKNVEITISETPYINQANKFQKPTFISLFLKLFQGSN